MGPFLRRAFSLQTLAARLRARVGYETIRSFLSLAVGPIYDIYIFLLGLYVIYRVIEKPEQVALTAGTYSQGSLLAIAWPPGGPLYMLVLRAGMRSRDIGFFTKEKRY